MLALLWQATQAATQAVAPSADMQILGTLLQAGGTGGAVIGALYLMRVLDRRNGNGNGNGGGGLKGTDAAILSVKVDSLKETTDRGFDSVVSELRELRKAMAARRPGD